MGTFLPCPEELKATVAGRAGADGSAAQLALETQERQNVELYGARNWYEWQIGNWGTKWDVGREKDHPLRRLPAQAKRLTLVFDSAWSPPIEFYNHLRTVEGFDITAYCFEPGVGFCGIYQNGKVTEFSVPSNFDELAKLPPDLIKAFAINEWVEQTIEDELDTDEEGD